MCAMRNKTRYLIDLSFLLFLLFCAGDGRVTPRPDRKLVTPVGSINQPQSYSVLSGTPRRAPLETATTFLSAISFAQVRKSVSRDRVMSDL